MRFLRNLVIALIAVALPLQGYAAVAMVACGPVHARAAGASHGHGATDHAQHDHAAHDHAAHGHPADDGSAAAASHAAHGHPGSDGGAASAAHHDVGCSACASCCSGSAVSAPLSSLA